MTGKVWLVGAGPGDRGLFTLKGLEVLQNADVVVYDALVGDEVMALIPEQAEKINVGKRSGNHRMPQERINRTLLDQALAGKKVVRLKGGDPFVFGRGGEELELLAANEIPYEVVPGVTSAFAVPAYNGIPVTHRDFTSSVHIITGHRRSSGSGEGRPEDPGSPAIDYGTLVRTKGTLIFLMGLAALPMIMRGLLDAGMDPAMPAAVLEKGTTARQRRLVATVSTLEEETLRAGIQAPAIIVVGEVCRLAESFAWAEKRPLAGKKILLTRPKEHISEMASRLRRLGAEVLEIPAIETVPITPNPVLDAHLQWLQGKEAAQLPGIKKEQLQESETGQKAPDWLVFTSPTGVRVFMDRLLEEGDIRSLSGIKIAAIGEGSAKSLRRYGIRADFIPSVYDGENLGRELADRIRRDREESTAENAKKPAAKKSLEAALEQEEIITSENQTVRILIPRVQIGSRELVEELEKAGDVEIEDLATYRTRYRQSDVIDLRERILQGDVDYAVFTSASTVRGFCAVMGETGPGDLSGLTAVCIGPQTRSAAEAAGMETRMAKKATLDALAEAVVECAAGTL